MSKLTYFDQTVSEPLTIQATDEYGQEYTCQVIASDQGTTISNHDAGERWKALLFVDFGDGDSEVHECKIGDTFNADCGQYVVRRTDNAGSLKWGQA